MNDINYRGQNLKKAKKMNQTEVKFSSFDEDNITAENLINHWQNGIPVVIDPFGKPEIEFGWVIEYFDKYLDEKIVAYYTSEDHFNIAHQQAHNNSDRYENVVFYKTARLSTSWIKLKDE